MNIGTFYSSTTTIDTGLLPTQEGVNELIVFYSGESVRRQEFGSALGETMKIPNLFREYGLQEFEIIQPDGTKYPSEDGCGLALMMLNECVTL